MSQRNPVSMPTLQAPTASDYLDTTITHHRLFKQPILTPCLILDSVPRRPGWLRPKDTDAGLLPHRSETPRPGSGRDRPFIRNNELGEIRGDRCSRPLFWGRDGLGQSLGIGELPRFVENAEPGRRIRFGVIGGPHRYAPGPGKAPGNRGVVYPRTWTVPLEPSRAILVHFEIRLAILVIYQQ